MTQLTSTTPSQTRRRACALAYAGGCTGVREVVGVTPGGPVNLGGRAPFYQVAASSRCMVASRRILAGPHIGFCAAR
jgi:hypothetical protein